MHHVRASADHVCSRRAHAREEAPAESRVCLAARGDGARHYPQKQSRGVQEVGSCPRIAGDVRPVRDLATTVLGQKLAMPVIGLSSFGSMPFEDVAAANPKAFFQLSWVGTRDDIAERVERARCGRQGAHPHLRLVVRGASRLGDAADPGARGSSHPDEVRSDGDLATRMDGSVRARAASRT